MGVECVDITCANPENVDIGSGKCYGDSSGGENTRFPETEQVQLPARPSMRAGTIWLEDEETINIGGEAVDVPLPARLMKRTSVTTEIDMRSGYSSASKQKLRADAKSFVPGKAE